MSLLQWWTSENSRMALRAKQWISSAIPDPALAAIKQRYYFYLLKNMQNSPVETDTLALPLVVKKGDFVIDIGAHVGFYTKDLASIVGAEGLVWSIEPIPQTFDILAYEIRKFRWSNVEAFNVAISDSEGSVKMEIPHFKRGGESWCDARIFSAETRHPNWRSLTVRTVTLDSLTSKSDRPVSFIKCDAEFHELPCLHGAQETIRRWHPAWLIETLADFYRNASDAEMIVQFLSAFGYTAYLFDGKNFRIRKPNEMSQNTFFFYRR
jgi:FkbM family methyltransferase